MFTFFAKKNFLVDHLEGFVDIHNHILPGIDDGAGTVEDSMEIIDAFSEFGVNRFIATPHVIDNYYPNTKETIINSLSLLNNGLKMKNAEHITVEASAEYMIDANFETILEEKAVLPIKENYLLVEMSYLQPSINFEESINQIALNRYFPILAHPERYIYLQKKLKKYAEYKKKGILFQLNLLSLSEFYGKEVQQTAIKLLEEELINYVASDIHNLAQIATLKEIKISDKVFEKLLPLIENTIYDFY